MNALISFLLLISIYSQISLEISFDTEEDLDVGYYWRDYNKDIPDDALPGGKDKRGKTTYIGQTVHGSCNSGIVVTGHIYEAEKQLKYEWGYRQQLAKNSVQILCTRHPEHFEWVDTNSTEIYNLTGRHLICGGREKNFTVYIGRIIRDDEIGIGKVLVTDLHYMEGMYTTLNGTYFHIQDSYSVLAYNPEVKQTSNPTAKLQSYKSSGSDTVMANRDSLLLHAVVSFYLFHFYVHL